MHRRFYALVPAWLIFATGLCCALEVHAQVVKGPPIGIGIFRAPLGEACLDGFVHRRAILNDWVCVTADVSRQAQADNKAAASRRSPGGGASGPDTCLSGFVWRSVTPNDHVCVTPDVHTAITVDNNANASRKKKPWCEQYAVQAMASVIAAAKGTCAPSDATLWSQNQTDHYTFCMQHPQTESSQANQTRDDNLMSCKEASDKAKQAEADAEAQKSAAAEANRIAEAKKKAESQRIIDEQEKQKQARQKCEEGTIIEQIYCKWFKRAEPDPVGSGAKSATANK